MRRGRLTALAAVAAVGLCGCGATASEHTQTQTTTDTSATTAATVTNSVTVDGATIIGNTISGDKLAIYVSVPQDGASAAGGQAVLNGATLALSQVHGHIGRYQLIMRVEDDSTPPSGQWSPAATTKAAALAAANPHTIGYIGDVDSGASAVSIPILNKLGIAQVSPTSSAVGLTSDWLVSEPGDPYSYYPTKLQTFVRVVPSDYYQAAAQIKLQQSAGCRSAYVLEDGEYDGAEASDAFDQLAQIDNYTVVHTAQYEPGQSSYLSYGQAIAQSTANCVLIAATPASSAAQLVEQVAQAAPKDQIFATASLAQPSFTNPAAGGLPASLDGRVMLTAAAGDPLHPNALLRNFDRAYRAKYGNPIPAAVDGYEAMRLLLQGIRTATDDGTRQAQRVKVVKALLDTRHHVSPLGTYGIKRDGNTTLQTYGVYSLLNGHLKYVRSIKG